MTSFAGVFSDFSLDASLDRRSVFFLLSLVCLLAAIFAGPALWQSSRLSQLDALKESGRCLVARKAAARKVLITLQIALTLAFVTGTTLLVSSLQKLYGIDLGIRTQGVWQVMLFPRPCVDQHSLPEGYYKSLVDQIAALPGIQSVALSNDMPLWTREYQQPVTLLCAGIQHGWRAAAVWPTDGYFKTLGIHIVLGEDFRRNDQSTGEPVAIVSRSLAEHLGGTSAILGRYIRMGNEAEYQQLKIVGVAADAEISLENPADHKPPVIYINWWQHPEIQGHPVLLVKARGNTVPINALRRMVNSNGREYMEHLLSLNAAEDAALIEQRLLAYVSGAFGILALLMAAAGLFGLLSYQISNRSSEIGIRIALGAQKAQIQWLMLREVSTLLAAGTIAGTVLSISVSRAIAGLLYGISGFGLPALAISVTVLTGTAAMAA